MTCLIVLLNRTAKINEIAAIGKDKKSDLNMKENKNSENITKTNENENQHENGEENSCNGINLRKTNYKFQLHSPP